MSKTKAFKIILSILFVAFFLLFLSSCVDGVSEGSIIVTIASENSKVPGDIVSGGLLQNFPEAQLIALDPEDPSKPIKVLTKGFYSAQSPKVSFDGKHILFAAQQKQGDVWQIWEMNLKNCKARKVVQSSQNCTYPTYLPGGRLVYGQQAAYGGLETVNFLFTCNLDGSDIKQITFSPQPNLGSIVLKDGRVLTVNQSVSLENKVAIYTAMRPDGTKAEMFYGGNITSSLGVAKETGNGKIVFVEMAGGSEMNTKSDVVSISYNIPLHSHVNLTEGIAGLFRDVFPMKSGKFLVACRPENEDRFGLYELDTDGKSLGKLIYHDPMFDVLEVTVIETQHRPRKLPSEVELGVKSGLLLCQDVNFRGIQTPEIASLTPRAEWIEIIGMDSTLGVVPLEKDGSFYLKVVADKPFRIQTLDEYGNVFGKPCNWLYLRPNERRGCVGCHEDPEQVPENRQPLAVKKDPELIPSIHMFKKEKEIDLE